MIMIQMIILLLLSVFSSQPITEVEVLAIQDYSYSGTEWNPGSFLSFKEGEIVTRFHVQHEDGDGWSDGSKDGKRGWFPTSHVIPRIVQVQLHIPEPKAKATEETTPAAPDANQNARQEPVSSNETTLGFTRSPTKEFNNRRILPTSLKAAIHRMKLKDGDTIVCKLGFKNNEIKVLQILGVKVWGKIQPNGNNVEFKPFSDHKAKMVPAQGIEEWLQDYPIEDVVDGKYLVGAFYNTNHELDFSNKADVVTFQKVVEEEYKRYKLDPKAEEHDESSIPDDQYENEREDMTNILTFTIDPKGAKDLDDALSVEFRSEESEWEDGAYARVTVHIADVTAFVTQDSKLFKCVRKRVTSVYAPGLMVPMLPRKLSEDKLSLREGKERPVVSISFFFSEDGDLLQGKEVFFRSMIQSNKAFSYDDLEKMRKGNKMFGENANMKEPIEYLMKVAKKLKIGRPQENEIGPRYETRIELDEKLQPCNFKQELVDKTSLFTTHELIEEFMLLTNKASSKQILIRRYHEKPEIDAETATELQQLGAPSDANFNSSDWIENIPNEENWQKARMIWQSKWKTAQYGLQSSVDDASHFSLGEKKYAHFTSPIRRYADMLAHLQIFGKQVDEDFKKLNEIVDKAKNLETRAMEAGLVLIIRRRGEPIEICAEVKNNKKTKEGQLIVGLGGKKSTFLDWAGQIPSTGERVTLQLDVEIRNYPKHALKLLDIKSVASSSNRLLNTCR